MKAMNPWDYTGHLEKSKACLTRAKSEGPGGDSYFLWLAFASEHLLRAAATKINPILGAETKNDDSILAIVGKLDASKFRTASIATVQKRLEALFPDLKGNLKILSLIQSERNQEAHSAISGFLSLQADWQAYFYKSYQLILGKMNLSLTDILGDEEAKVATEMIEALEEKVIAETMKEVSDAKTAFFALLPAVQEEKRINAERFVQGNIGLMVTAHYTSMSNHPAPGRKEADCPACSSKIILNGRIIHESEPQFDDGNIYTQLTVLPTHFGCTACGLNLRKNAELSVVGLGSQYKSIRYENINDFVEHDDEDADYEAWGEDRFLDDE